MNRLNTPFVKNILLKFLVVYLLFAFIYYDINPRNWTITARLIIVGLFLYIGHCEGEEEEKKRKKLNPNNQPT